VLAAAFFGVFLFGYILLEDMDRDYELVEEGIQELERSFHYSQG
jgi:hypothetical protein